MPSDRVRGFRGTEFVLFVMNRLPRDGHFKSGVLVFGTAGLEIKVY